MPNTLHVGRPNLGNRKRFFELTNEIFDRCWLTNNGPVVKELEKTLCSHLGVRHCIPVNNATIGLQIAGQALDLTGEVIVPAFTFVATPHSLQWEGITPVFCDIDPTTHQLDPRKVETLITPRTSAILGVHAWGRACCPEDLQQIADRNKLTLYFDAAHAFGCSHSGRFIGNFGRCEVFSFHATKFFNTFEGGAIATNDDELAERIRLMINFGFSGADSVIHLGTNGKMSEVHAAMGLACYETLETILETNSRHYNYYRKELSPLRGVHFHDYDDVERSNFQYVVIEIDPNLAKINRDQLMQSLHAQGIMVRRYFYPGCHKMEPYTTQHPGLLHNLPNTDALCEKVMALPTGTGITEEEVEQVCSAIIDELTSS